MEYKGCYEPVIELVSEGTGQFDGYALNKEKYGMLDVICKTADRLVSEIEDCECVNASIDDTTKQLTISILCDDVIFQHGRTSVFFQLIQMLSSFSFSKAKGGLLRIDLNIDGVWEKKSGC